MKNDQLTEKESSICDELRNSEAFKELQLAVYTFKAAAEKLQEKYPDQITTVLTCAIETKVREDRKGRESDAFVSIGGVMGDTRTILRLSEDRVNQAMLDCLPKGLRTLIDKIEEDLSKGLSNKNNEEEE